MLKLLYKYLKNNILKYGDDESGVADFKYVGNLPDNHNSIAGKHSQIRDISVCRDYFRLCNYYKDEIDSRIINHIKTFYQITERGLQPIDSFGCNGDYISSIISCGELNKGELIKLVELGNYIINYEIKPKETGFAYPQALIGILDLYIYLLKLGDNNSLKLSNNNSLKQFMNNCLKKCIEIFDKFDTIFPKINLNNSGVFYANWQVQFLVQLCNAIEQHNRNTHNNRENRDFIKEVIDKIINKIIVIVNKVSSVNINSLQYNEVIVLFEMYCAANGIPYLKLYSESIRDYQTYIQRFFQNSITGGIGENDYDKAIRIDFTGHCISALLYKYGKGDLIQEIWNAITDGREFIHRMNKTKIGSLVSEKFDEIEIKQTMLFLTILNSENGKV